MKTPILDALIEVMEKVAADNLLLSMHALYQKYSVLGDKIEEGLEDINIHNCGTACCVMGYASLDKKVRNLVGIDQKLNSVDAYRSTSIIIWKELENEITEELANSIALGNQEDRLSSAEQGLFDLNLSCCWLSEYPHVYSHENNENSAEAVRYMKKLREVLQSVEK